MSSNYLPIDFQKKYKEILKNEYDKFIESCNTRITKSFILNTHKTNDLSFFKKLNIEIEKTKIIDNAYFIKTQTLALGNIIEQNIGLFLMQEISSMLPAIVLNPKETDVVLDLTAAPGNKTALLSLLMNNKGLIVANDIDKKRIKTLIFTLKKMGVTNSIITNQNGFNFNMNLLFDKILIDAPCSCEGMIRKKKDALKEWSEKNVQSKSEIQKKLILKAYDLLKKDGEIVYSTCTLSPEENEEVIDFLMSKKKCEIEEIKINGLKETSGLTEYNQKKYHKDLKKAIRIWPHKNDMEGFFICKIKKIE